MATRGRYGRGEVRRGERLGQWVGWSRSRRVVEILGAGLVGEERGSLVGVEGVASG